MSDKWTEYVCKHCNSKFYGPEVDKIRCPDCKQVNTHKVVDPSQPRKLSTFNKVRSSVQRATPIAKTIYNLFARPGQRWESIPDYEDPEDDPEVAQFLKNHKDLQGKAYNASKMDAELEKLHGVPNLASNWAATNWNKHWIKGMLHPKTSESVSQIFNNEYYKSHNLTTPQERKIHHVRELSRLDSDDPRYEDHLLAYQVASKDVNDELKKSGKVPVCESMDEAFDIHSAIIIAHTKNPGQVSAHINAAGKMAKDAKMVGRKLSTDHVQHLLGKYGLQFRSKSPEAVEHLRNNLLKVREDWIDDAIAKHKGEGVRLSELTGKRVKVDNKNHYYHGHSGIVSRPHPDFNGMMYVKLDRSPSEEKAFMDNDLKVTNEDFGTGGAAAGSGPVSSASDLGTIPCPGAGSRPKKKIDDELQEELKSLNPSAFDVAEMFESLPEVKFIKSTDNDMTVSIGGREYTYAPGSEMPSASELARKFQKIHSFSPGKALQWVRQPAKAKLIAGSTKTTESK